MSKQFVTISEEMSARPPKEEPKRGEASAPFSGLREDEWRRMGEGLDDREYLRLVGERPGADEPAVVLSPEQLEALDRWYYAAQDENRRMGSVAAELCAECGRSRDTGTALAPDNDQYSVAEVVHECGLVRGRLSEEAVRSLYQSTSDEEKDDALAMHEKKKQQRRKISQWEESHPESVRQRQKSWYDRNDGAARKRRYRTRKRCAIRAPGCPNEDIEVKGKVDFARGADGAAGRGVLRPADGVGAIRN